jgi:hypothetical protein
MYECNLRWSVTRIVKVICALSCCGNFMKDGHIKGHRNVDADGQGGLVCIKWV